MYLSPSKILYTNCIELGSFSEFPSQDCLLKVTRSIQKGGVYPKLQVVKKDGYYFTLNDTQLRLYRYLEKVGQCGSVHVDRVPLREVPEGIRNLMKAPDANAKYNLNQKHNGKYHSIDSKEENIEEALNGQENSSEDDEEASSQDDDSDEDETEWSDDDNSSNTDGNSSTQENDDNDDVAESESFI